MVLVLGSAASDAWVASALHGGQAMADSVGWWEGFVRCFDDCSVVVSECLRGGEEIRWG